MMIQEKKKMTHWDLMANLKKGHKWEGNILQKIAEEIVRYAIPMEEVIKNDLTLEFLKELEREILNKEIIKIQIIAKPRLGKSTVAINLAQFIDSLLKKYKMKSEEIEFGMRNICRDQNEYAKRMRNPKMMYEVEMVDENNKSEDTGENSTSEKAQRETMSDVMAGRYVHTVYVCPEGMMDNNTDIKLEVRNRDKGLTHCRISYHMKSQLYYGWVLIGIVDLDVSNLIKNWINVEPRFMRYLKEGREDDRKYLEYWRKRDFYVVYMIRKYEKMELMLQEGIMHTRDLDYAEMRKENVESLKSLARLLFVNMTRLRNNVRVKVEQGFTKRKMPLTMVGKEEETNRVMAFLELYRSIVETEANINQMISKFQRGKISEHEYNTTITLLKEALESLKEQAVVQEAYLEKLVKLNERYNIIDGQET